MDEHELLARALGRVMRARRAELGLSQELLAQYCGIDRRHYQDLEHGFSNGRTGTLANPRLMTLSGLAGGLDMELTEFIARIEEEANEESARLRLREAS